MSLLLLFALAVLGLTLIQWALGPRRMKDGRTRLKDHADGLAAGLWAFLSP